MTEKMERDAAEAIAKVVPLAVAPRMMYETVGDHGFHGNLIFTIEDESKAYEAQDAAVRAVAPYAYPD